MLAIIGGSGLTTLSNLDVSHREVVRTPYGEPSGPVVFGEICGKPAMFLPRHGYGHTIPPHTVNYRANLWALNHHKATGVISVASVGGIRNDLQPGDVVLIAFDGVETHVGLIGDYPIDGELSLIHAYIGARKVVEHRLDAQWRSRIVGAYRVPAFDEVAV